MEFRSELEAKWLAVRALCADGRSYMGYESYINETPPPEVFNLPFLLAYALLGQYSDENGIGFGPKAQLGEKLKKLETVLCWSNFRTIDEGRCRRNDLAHRASLSKPDCLRYIIAIGDQLAAWGLIR
jgi:hypothetical protein